MVGRSGIWMSRRWPAPPHSALLVPVPLHWRRNCRWGFNPSEALAIGLAQGWGLEKPQNLLRRVKYQSPLSQASRRERLDALLATYQLGNKEQHPQLNVILVDDVLTTGATFRACRHACERMGHHVLGGIWLGMA